MKKATETTQRNVMQCIPKKQIYTGCANDTVQFFEREQLFDIPLWKSFVQQFRDQQDGENQGWRGEYWGKMMRGAVMVYEYSQNRELYQF